MKTNNDALREALDLALAILENSSTYDSMKVVDAKIVLRNAIAQQPAPEQAKPVDFPKRIMDLLRDVADRKGTETRGPWEDGNGEPMQDDAEAAIAWINAKAAPVAASKPEQQAQAGEPEVDKDKLRTRLNIILGQINRLEWKTGVGGSYFETVQEQCEAIAKDFGLKKLPPHVMTLPISWVRRNPGVVDGYEIIEPREFYASPKAIAKRDAALQACVVALNGMLCFPNNRRENDAGRAAITKAQEALK